ncbi:MAG TPA: hypothetical protein VK463_19785 [Desulfomonilaceae bacterium]|nr:hypothetical protein [Desulfomonilaceae bacterium]
MRKTKRNGIARIVGIVSLLTLASTTFLPVVSAQMQPWLQEERMRQMYDRQQLLMWQQQEQMRQMYDRQQLLMWQQQERLRQMYQR